MRVLLNLALFALLTTVVFSAEPYTVILKNGKMMKGQLLSENDDVIVFKDEKGLQYSLKKSLLDLEKMKKANEPPPTEPAPSETQSEQTAEEPEPETESTSEPGIQSTSQRETTPPVVPVPVNSPEESSSYSTKLHEAAVKLETAFQDAKSLLDGMMTAWEVNASTGRDPASALQEFKATKGTAITVSVNAQLQMLQKLRERLNDPPVQYSSAFELFTAAIQELNQYYDAVRQYEGKPALRVFRSRLSTAEQSIQKKIGELKAFRQ